jgi:basic membrane protein A
VNVVASACPNTQFACSDYAPPSSGSIPPNVAGLEFREEEGSFLVGALAAGLSHTGKVGFVGGMEIPLIKKFEAGYKAGVHAVRPKADVIVKYAGTTGAAFKDPTKGKELGLAEYQQGADIIYHASGSTGLGVFEAAKDTKHLAIGVDSDQYDEAPGTVVSSMVKHVEVAVFNTIRAAQQGHFQGGVQSYGLAENGVGWVYDARNATQIPAPVKATVDSLRDLIVAGKIAVPSQ